jgi:hypothetical protein
MWTLGTVPLISDDNPYASPLYTRAHKFFEDKNILYLNFEAKNICLSIPVFERKLVDDWSELTDAYGYSGFSGFGTLSTADMWNLKEFLRLNSILSLFIRHNPILGNSDKIPSEYSEYNRPVYLIECKRHRDLENGLEFINPKFRRSIRRSLRNDISFVVEDFDHAQFSFANFIKLYYETMRKNNAAQFYFFTEDYFPKLQCLREKLKLVYVLDENKIMQAAALIIIDQVNKCAYYHLGGVRGKNHEMEYLFSKTANYLSSRDISTLNLGGGLFGNEQDGLSKFKDKISDLKKDFFVTKLCSDTAMYHQIRSYFGVSGSSYFLVSDALRK